MEYKDAQVALRIFNLGTQISRGSYEFQQTGWEIETKGNSLNKYPKGILKIKAHPKFSESYTRTSLGSTFVENAVSDKSRPYNITARHWKNLSRKNRLIFHIKQYVEDLYGDAKFEYELIN